MHWLIWIGIVLCLLHAALFSGLTLGLFGLSLLRLEVLATTGHSGAARILALRKDANLLLSTLLWGNVSANVGLTLLTGSVLKGLSAFLFSTVVIMFVAELAPQAYFSRSALKAGALLAPLVQLYGLVLFPVARPTASLLDLWLGKQGIRYFSENELKTMLKLQTQARLTDVGLLEGIGAANFLSLDDIPVEKEGESLDPRSIIVLEGAAGVPVFPAFSRTAQDPFLQRIAASGRKWVVLTDASGYPVWVLNADPFLRAVFMKSEDVQPQAFCHHPIVVTVPGSTLGQVISQWRVAATHPEDDVIDHDVVLYWGEPKRIITGADVLGRLLRGIVPAVPSAKDT